MQCVRCGTVFEGHFCPRCGAPAAPLAAPAATGWPCPRCGTVFQGNFCPRCGLATAAWTYRPSPGPSAARSVLSILWTLAMVGFLVFALSDFAGLLVAPTLVVPGIQGMSSGQTLNAALDFEGNWAFDNWSSAASGRHLETGGNPGGYLEMNLPSAGSRGSWMQAFDVDGSTPYAARIRLDVQVVGALTSGRLFVAVDRDPGPPNPAAVVEDIAFVAPRAWSALDRIVADARIDAPGTYYLKLAFVATSSDGPVAVGIDNARLAWTTDAFVYLFLPVPTPIVVFVSQDRGLFLGTYVAIIATVLAAAAYHAIRERKLLWDAVRAPLAAIGERLRSRSAWIAIAQTWMAVSFFQIAFFILVVLAGVDTSSPIEIVPATAWFWLFELVAASVREEFAFRLLLIGVPMAVGSLVLRSMEVNRGSGSWNGRSPARKHIAGAGRYLVGGAVSSKSSKEALVAAWALLFASSAIFGAAHIPGWGLWKAFPSFVAGLGFGYLFLRHGIGAAILAHFVNNYALSLYYAGIGGTGLLILLNLVFLALVAAGAGFFVWYGLVAWRALSDLVRKFRPTAVRIRPPAAAPVATATITPPPMPVSPPPSPAPQPPWPQPSAAGFPSGPAATGPSEGARDALHIPRDYVPTYRAPPYGYPPVRFLCPQCGWVEARYADGRFTCTRCGRVA